MQWLRGRTSDSRLRGLGFKSCAAVLKPRAGVFTPHYSSSLSCINEYVAIDSGGYMYEQPLRINLYMDGCFPEMLRWCVIEQVCQQFSFSSSVSLNKVILLEKSLQECVSTE